MAPLRCVCTLHLALICVLAAAGVRAESLRLPLTVDLELLRTLIVQQAYPIPGEKASILNMGQGCNQIALLSPRVSVDQGYLRYQTGVAWQSPKPELRSWNQRYASRSPMSTASPETCADVSGVATQRAASSSDP